ncbi:MAG: globin [Pirellulaceae bacterium]
MNIHQSLEQILRSKDAFGEAFYQGFFEAYPHVKPYFDDVNLKRQAVLLTMALIIIERYYYEPFKATEQYLQYLGTRHHEWNIPRDLYPQWADAMLTALKSFHGEDWNDGLAQQWKEAIGRATELIFEGYDERFRL